MYVRLVCLLGLMLGFSCQAGEREEYNDETENAEIPVLPDTQHKSIFDVMFSKDGAGQGYGADAERPDGGNVITITESNEGSYAEVAVIKVIDRTLGKLNLIEVPVQQSRTFNGLTFSVKKCWNPSEVKIIPTSRMLLDITQNDNGNISNLFSGWMIANHPSVSYMKHEKYDVSLKLCKPSKAVVADKVSKSGQNP